ncbi:MAG: hypothetical protein DLM68_01675, partial [Hyphomicrobiales bacterium]
RFFAVHMGDPLSNQATPLESQVIHRIQYLSGQTLSGIGPVAIGCGPLSPPIGDPPLILAPKNVPPS